MYLSDCSRLSGCISCRVVHTSLVAITHLILDPDRDHILDRDRLADRASHDVAHTSLIATAYRGPHQPDRDHIPDCDQYLDLHIDRGIVLGLLIVNVLVPLPVVL